MGYIILLQYYIMRRYCRIRKTSLYLQEQKVVRYTIVNIQGYKVKNLWDKDQQLERLYEVSHYKYLIFWVIR